MTAAGAGTLRTGKGCAVLAGGGDRACALRLAGPCEQRQTGDHSNRQREVSHYTHSFGIHRDSIPIKPFRHSVIAKLCELISDSCGVDLSEWNYPSDLGQRGAKMTGCYADLAAKDRGQVALVAETDFPCNHSERLIGAAHQSFCPLDPPVHYVTLRPQTNRLLKAAAEVVGTETCHSGEIGQG